MIKLCGELSNPCSFVNNSSKCQLYLRVCQNSYLGIINLVKVLSDQTQINIFPAYLV